LKVVCELFFHWLSILRLIILDYLLRPS
jgi:hypothetical protein